MRVAVIGGSGLVGRQLEATLSASGHQPVAIARRARDGARPVDVVGTRPGALAAAIDGCDAVIFAAGSLRQGLQTFHDVQVAGARHLVAACRAARVRRVIHLSALGAAPGSRSAFLRAKAAGEELVRRSLLDATVLRPSAIFGPEDDFVRPLARMLRALPVAPLPGRGEAVVAPISARDVARAVGAALAQPDTVGQAYDLPGPERLTIAEVYQRLLAALRITRPLLRVPYAIIEPASYLVRTVPGFGFTFDQLAVLEAGAPDDDHHDPLGIAPLARLDELAIRAIVGRNFSAAGA